MTITLSEEVAALVLAYCERTGATREAAVDDLVRRGLTHVDVGDMRQDVQDIRAAVLDIEGAQDALAPYAIAVLSVLAHWSVKTGGTTLSEVKYQNIALDTGRLIWDALLADRGIPVPERPPAERSPDAPSVG
jgi:hypothetical protein